MFLKRLEISGFKSFAEKVGIEFVPGVTAVVGPNGSGKSNITDAIRWVLGEQSAKSLRGSKMEDVIFSGSDSRKPLNFAEVSLILDNSLGLFPIDYTEISVTRRVFRSGESAYLLNGQPCRLKDITDLFMDSGLGKEAFSIISQGRVDEILNSRPEDRRNIFDEAAGVLKYRKRKQKAEHKLFETSDNLDRVLDILQELDTRLVPLEQQATAAVKHRQITEELKDVEIHLLNADALNCLKEIESKKTTLSTLIRQLNQHQADEQAIEQEIEQLKEQLDQLHEELETLQQQLMTTITETEKWEGRKLLTAEKVKNASEQLQRIEKSICEFTAEKDTLTEKLKTNVTQYDALTKESRMIDREVKDAQSMLTRSVSETEAQIEDLKAAYIDGLNEEATIRNDLKHLYERMEGQQTTSQKTMEETAALQDTLSSLKECKTTLVKKIQEQTKLLQQSKKQFEVTKQTLEQTETDLKEKEQLLQSAFHRQHEMQGRLRMLESLEADFSGFYSGVKEVLQAREKRQLKGIEGAVAELIDVDRPYIQAIETALGGAMQNIVTTTEGDAHQAIQYLKQKNKGRATFLPLDVIRPRMVPQQAIRELDGNVQFVGVANQLISSQEQYQSIIDNLLGTVLVAKTLVGASAIAKKLNYRFRVVTLEGDIVNAGGSLSGGGRQQKSSVFSRKSELEQLKQKTIEMGHSIERGQKTIQDIKYRLSAMMTEQNQCQLARSEHEETVRALENEKLTIEMEIRTVSQRLETIEIGLQSVATTKSELDEKKAALEKRHLLLKDELQCTQEEISKLERLTADWRNEEEKLTNRLTNLREQSVVLREKLTYKKQEIAQCETTIDEYHVKINQLSQEQHFLQRTDAEQLSSDDIELKIQTHIQRRKQLEKQIVRLRERRTMETNTLIEHEHTYRELRETIKELQEDVQEVKLSLSRVEMTYDSVTKKLWNTYGLKPDVQVQLAFDAVEKRARLKELQHMLEEIGPVNPNAVEEYEEVKQRHDFLTTQRNDLIDAQETLENAMNEMDEEMMTRFSSTFEAVKLQFRRVFQEMFGGGNADLLLTNPEDLLSTGVDIIARPPGKKMQSLSLLSGGERALTAISLLFAIIEVRPVPFCILDEVEAALDEANVTRYSNYLKRCSDKTQFIVITHRKGTMEGADVLYGITMQESGVSKLISVKLSEIPHEALVE